MQTQNPLSTIKPNLKRNVASAIVLFCFISGSVAWASSSAPTSDDAIAARVQPEGKLNVIASEKKMAVNAEKTVELKMVDETKKAMEPKMEEPKEKPMETTAAIDGAKIYNTSCLACHASGILNAPKLGDVAAWKPRIDQGMNTLIEHAIKGFNTMPPKGGNAQLSDAEVTAVVKYMVDNSQ
jgi:cytochrome c5